MSSFNPEDCIWTLDDLSRGLTEQMHWQNLEEFPLTSYRQTLIWKRTCVEFGDIKTFIITPDMFELSSLPLVMLPFWLLELTVAHMNCTVMVAEPHIIKLSCNVLLVAWNGCGCMKGKSSGFGCLCEVYIVRSAVFQYSSSWLLVC